MVMRLVSVSILLLGTFSVTSVALGESTLNFPRLSNETNTITGVTFVNPGDVGAVVNVSAYGTNGNLIQGTDIQNPAQLVVPPGEQVGLLVNDPALFGPGLPQDVVGWFQAVSPADDLTGFFLFLDNPGNSTFLDGADLPPLDHKILFNRIQVGDGTSTELNIFNSEMSTTVLELLLIDGDRPDPIVRTLSGGDALPGRGVLRLDVQSFFGVGQVSADAYVLIISDTLIGGFELVKSSGGDLLGLNARSGGEMLNTIYFPQLAVLGPWQMEIAVNNYAPEPVSLLIAARKPNGELYGSTDLLRNPVRRNLGAGFGLREDVEEMFGFQGDKPLDGWIEVLASDESVNGYVNYGVPGQGSIAAVAAVTQPRSRAIFSHIATTRGFFTGLAALNPSSRVANLRVVALTAKNQILGHFDTVLKPGERISRTLQEMIPAAAGQAGGIIWVKSDQPLYMTSLFGTGTGRVLSNIPPQPSPAEYQPDIAENRLAVEPAFSVLRIPGVGTGGDSEQFSASENGVSWLVEDVPGGSPELGTIDATGFYEAPSQLPVFSPLSIFAEKQAAGSAQPVRAGATVDLLDSIPLSSNREISHLLFLPISARLFAVVSEGQSSIISELAFNGQNLQVEFSDLLTFAGETVTGAAVFRSSFGDEYLILALGDRLVRLEPLSGGADSVEILTGNTVYSTLALDPVTGNLLAVSNNGVTEISGAELEADLVGPLAGGSSPRSLFQLQHIKGLAVDPCSGEILFTRQVPSVPGDPQSPVEGEIGFYSRVTRETRTVIREAGRLPAVVVPLQRRGSSCEVSTYFLWADELREQISLLTPSGAVLDWYPVDAVSPSGVIFLPFDQDLYAGIESVLAMSQTGGSRFLNIIDVLNLFQQETENPLDVRAVNVEIDRAGDFFGFETEQHDILETSVRYEGSSLVVEVFFGDSIAACTTDPCFDANQNPPGTVTGYVDIDLDRNPASGVIPAVDFNSPYTAGIGVDFSLDFTVSWAAGTVLADRFTDGQSFEVPVQVNGNSLKASIPVSIIGGARTVYFANVFGTSNEPTDVSSNRGYLIASPGGAGAAFSSSNAFSEPSIRGVPASARREHSSGGLSERGWNRRVVEGDGLRR